MRAAANGWVVLLFAGAIASSAGCGDDANRDRNREGMQPGDCSDGADNDGDGDFDCDDDGCMGAPDCRPPTDGGMDAMLPDDGGVPDDASFDAEPLPDGDVDAAEPFDAGDDAGEPFDAGDDADVDAGEPFDAAADADVDGGVDAGEVDSGIDAGTDSGTPMCGAELVNESFESTAIGAHPSGWLEGCFSGSSYLWGANSTARSGTRSLRMDFRGSGGEAAVGIPVTWPTSGRVEVSFWFRPETTTQNIYILAVRGDSRLFNSLPFERTGNFQGTSTPYTAGTWYFVEYDIDFDASQFVMSVDGLEILRGPFAASAVPCALAGGSYLSFHGGYVDQKWLGYVDDLRIVNHPSTCPTPVTRYALSFDGDGDQVQFPMSFGDVGTRFTFEAWVRPTATTLPWDVGGTVFVHRADCRDFWLEYSRDGAGRFGWLVYPASGCGGQVEVRALNASAINTWHHVAAVFDDGNMRLYVDGVLEGTGVQSMPISWSTALLGHWAGRDGPDSRGTRAAFIGQIDEIRISRVARYSGSTIAVPAHLDADANTVAAWLFDEGTGTTANDASASGFDGTITGATWVMVSR